MKALNSSGFSSLSLMVLLPLILSLLAGGAWIGRQLFEWNGQHHQCRLKTLEHQNELRTYLQQILRLNPKAKSLLTQERLAQAALIAATAAANPAAIQVAQLKLRKIKINQVSLRSQQQIILGLAKISAQKFKWQILKQNSIIQKQIHKAQGPYIYPLAVEPVPPQAIAPQYLPVQQFSKLQNIGLSFRKDLSDWAFMSSVFYPGPQKALELRIECGSTLKQENGRWYTHLSEAKPSLKL